ncbi:hypothetical protein SAMN05216229_12344 [Geopseudomonas sagittaria]|uniref:Uncharacterized protein n=1 Tax=Geopseudomonas sagittaria TaxID=1135990 RepID=A0A1I5YQF4_9GAMM|nr:hypothetical protein [Pseudomonas sagittaria]SFQ46498.1 hypothetical protein SAMN05216229_12344 [Pseudomonas sagittaria]
MSEAKHTAGPWRWEINEKHKTMQLAGGVPKYDITVMCFERWGMHSAVPMLRNTAEDGMNIMHRCTDFAVPVSGREHHAHWLKTIDHPDARLISAAPELLEALTELVTDMVIAQGNMRDAAKHDARWEGCADAIQPRIDSARAAIAKARGN